MTDDAGQPEQDRRSPRRAPRTPRGTLNAALVAYMAINLAYGVPMLLFPNFLWGTIGGAEGQALEALESTRWAGAILVAFAAGVFLLLAVPRGQRTFVTTLALHYSLAAAALLFSTLTGEFDDIVGLRAWFPWLATVVVALAALYIWYARFKARDLLNE